MRRLVCRALPALPALLVAAAALAAPPLQAAPADTALAREVTAEVNGALARLERTAFTAQLKGVAYKSQVRAWRDAGGVRKVEVTDADDSGSVVSEYYFRGTDLVFAYVAIKGWKGEREVTRNERRQYYRGATLVQWLDGLDKVPRSSDDPEFRDEARRRLEAAQFYREAAGLSFRKGKTP